MKEKPLEWRQLPQLNDSEEFTGRGQNWVYLAF